MQWNRLFKMATIMMMQILNLFQSKCNFAWNKHRTKKQFLVSQHIYKNSLPSLALNCSLDVIGSDTCAHLLRADQHRTNQKHKFEANVWKALRPFIHPSNENCSYCYIKKNLNACNLMVSPRLATIHASSLSLPVISWLHESMIRLNCTYSSHLDTRFEKQTTDERKTSVNI